jgi:hypothetical protein
MIGFASAVMAATGEAAKAGPFAVLVIALLCLACYFLFRSMSRHLRKVREEFPSEERAHGEPGGDGGTGEAPPPSSATP